MVGMLMQDERFLGLGLRVKSTMSWSNDLGAISGNQGPKERTGGLVGFTGVTAPSSHRLDSFWLFPTAYCFPSPVSCSLNHGGSPLSPAHVFHCFFILRLQSYPWFIVLSATDLKMEGCLPVCIHHSHLWRFIAMVTLRLLWKKLGSFLPSSRSGFYGLGLFSNPFLLFSVPYLRQLQSWAEPCVLWQCSQWGMQIWLPIICGVFFLLFVLLCF